MIKKVLFGWVFKDYFRLYEEQMKKLNNALAKKIEEVYKLKKYKKILQDNNNLVNEICSSNLCNIIMGIENNKDNETMYIVKTEYSNSIDFKLYNLLCFKNKVLPIMECQIHEYNNIKYIEILDNHAIDENVGNGSILMKYLIKYAENNNISYVEGSLSPADKDHFDLLEHYYKKFEFEIKFNKKKTSGDIKRII